MNYATTKILRDVRMVLDENHSNNELLKINADTLDLDTIITEKIEHGAKDVLMVAPLSMIDTEQRFDNAKIDWNGGIGVNSGSVILPLDFMRFVKFMMNDWHIPVVVATNDTDVDYFKQLSPFAGIRGNANRPKCVLTKSNKGRVLEFYGGSDCDNAFIKYATYIPLPLICDGLINIPEQLYQSVVYQIAGLVATTYKDSIAQGLFALSASQIQTAITDGNKL